MQQKNNYDEFEISGRWWLAGSGHKAYGILSTQPEIRLRLEGIIGEPLRKTMFEEPVIIHGISKNNELSTLIGCLEIELVPSYCSNPFSEFFVHQLFLGEHLASKEDLAIKKVVLSYPGLENSLKKSTSLTSDLTNFRERVDISWEKPNDISIDLVGYGAKLEFVWNVSYVPSKQKTSVGDFARASLTFETPQNYQSVSKAFGLLTDALSTLHGMSCPPTTIWIYREGEEDPNRLEVYFNAISDGKFLREPASHKLLICLFHFTPEEREQFFQAWFAMPDEMDFAISWFNRLVMAPIENNYVVFFNFAQVLESLHRAMEGDTFISDEEFEPHYLRVKEFICKEIPNKKLRYSFSSAIRHAKKYQQKERFMKLFKLIPKDIRNQIAEHPGDCIGKIVDTRNFIGHLDPKSEEKSLEAAQMAYATMGLRIIFRVIILLHFGIKPQTLERQLQRNFEFRHFQHGRPWPLTVKQHLENGS